MGGRVRGYRAWGFVCALGCFVASPAGALSIFYEPVDLPEGAGEPDLWEYRYTIEDFGFGTGYGFSVLFDYQSYGELLTPLPDVGPDWEAFAIQPDAGLSSDGRYETEAQTENPSQAVVFRVQFEWLGSAPPGPGAQPFEVLDPSLQTVESGSTVLVPEPATAGPLGAGLALLALGRRRRHGRACGRRSSQPSPSS